MKLVFFTHPSFLTSQSMPRFAKMLSEGMKEKGHDVETLSPKPLFYNIPFKSSLKKWLGYIDQYLIFPFQVKQRLKAYPADTLYIFVDQALGPWIPLLADKNHVVHCHDFLAQRSALGEIPENSTKWFGRKYQEYIRNGYKAGRNFISVSKNTQTELHRFLGFTPNLSKVVYNGLDKSFSPKDKHTVRASLKLVCGINLSNGYILHVGGNQWYKNRIGVIKIYEAYRSVYKNSIPLLLIGAKPSNQLNAAIEKSAFKSDIHVLTGQSDEFVKSAYAGASLFVFPSLAEGFGWPISEAMASGCPVITTNEAPMTEVAGNAAFLIPVMPKDNDQVNKWAIEAADVVNKALTLDDEEYKLVLSNGYQNVSKFDKNVSLQAIENIYMEIISNSKIV